MIRISSRHFVPWMECIIHRWSNVRRRGTKIRIISETATAGMLTGMSSDFVIGLIAEVKVAGFFRVFTRYSQLRRIREEAGVEPTASAWPLESLLSWSAVI